MLPYIHLLYSKQTVYSIYTNRERKSPRKTPGLLLHHMLSKPLIFNLRFICIGDSEVLLLLEVEVGGHKVQQVLRHKLGLREDIQTHFSIVATLRIFSNVQILT